MNEIDTAAAATNQTIKVVRITNVDPLPDKVLARVLPLYDKWSRLLYRTLLRATVDDPAYMERFIGRWAAGIAFDLDYWTRKTGKEVTANDVEASTWALAEVARAPPAAGQARRWVGRR